MSRHQYENIKMRPSNKPHTVFPDLSVKSDQFHFGLETEFLLVETPSFKPLWYKDLSFEQLNETLESIDFSDVKGDYSKLEVEVPHRKLMPYLVEGYNIPDANFQNKDVWPKGLEIRTPACDSIEDCLNSFKALHKKLQRALVALNIKMVSLSHHPTEDEFSGPMNKRRYDFWQWAMQVMTTYGPDINLSVPTDLIHDFNLQDFERKINFYAPALAATSVASPFVHGDLWKTEGLVGKSYRSHKRSIVAPAIEYHADEGNRFEFKVFEMSPFLQDYNNDFLLFLTLVLDNSLIGRCGRAERIYKLGEVARLGLNAPDIKKRLEAVRKAAEIILPQHRFRIESLVAVDRMLETGRTLADAMIDEYQNSNQSIAAVLESLSDLNDYHISDHGSGIN